MLGGNASMAISSIWTHIANWSTPTILFCLLNLMIAIIFIASNSGNNHHVSEQVNSASEITGSEQVNITKELTRAPSFFDRVKSFKLTSPFKSNSPPDDTFTSQDEHFDVVEDHNDASDNSHYNNLSNVSGKSSTNLAKRSTSHLTKSSSEKRVVESVDNEDEDVDRRRPATMRESVGTKDECVNAKADDFIKRFKQQLKLQRLDSLQRFRDMLNRGT
ncbi:reverse transcriptase domain-containing protein [Tanacetum coccineum]